MNGKIQARQTDLGMSAGLDAVGLLIMNLKDALGKSLAFGRGNSHDERPGLRR